MRAEHILSNITRVCKIKKNIEVKVTVVVKPPANVYLFTSQKVAIINLEIN